MALRLTKAWQPLTTDNAKALPGQLGVYELSDATGKTVAFGFGGARALFGLRSELMELAARPPHGATQFRVEINQQYTTRYQELLMLHVHDHGQVPAGNIGKPLPTLGRLSPL